MGVLFASLAVVCPAQTFPTYTISAAVGTGTAGFSGDGAAAVEAEVNYPSAMAMDSSGNLYICDTANFRIRKVDTSGNISTICGTGTKGDSGDGKAATDAEIGYPGGIAVDAAGNIFFSDTANHKIRKIDSKGIITAFAGTGTNGFSGDYTDYVKEYNKANNITTLPVATDAKINTPTGIAADTAGNVYFCDTGNNRIRRVSVTDSTITTVAGDGTGAFYGDGAAAIYSELNHPISLAFDAGQNLYVADSLNHRIRKIAAADQTITTVAGLGKAGKADNGGYAINSQLHYPNSVSVDASGNLYISDFINNRVRMVNTSGLIATIAGSGKFGNTGDGGPALLAKMYFPCGVLVDAAGKVYLIDDANNRIRLLTPDATTVTNPTTGTSTGATNPTARIRRRAQ
jgi:sugar lactone lactonase YvrE